MNPVTETPLFSREAEQCILGGLMVSPVSLAEVAVLVSPDDFVDHAHRLIFTAMQELAAKQTPIDLLTVGERLESQGHCPEPVPIDYLVHLARETPSAANVLAYAGLVSSRSQRRRLLKLADQLAVWTREEHDPAKVLAKMRAALDGVAEQHPLIGLRPLADLLPDVLADLDDRAHRTQALLGRPTGLADLDRLLDGLCAGRLYVIAGRPSSGKSVLGLQCAREALRDELRVAFFSLEMPAAEVVHRLLAADIPLALDKIQSARMSDGEWNALAHAAERLAPVGLWIDDTSSMTINDLLARARRLHRQAPVGLVVVDYIGLVDGERSGSGDYSNRVQEIGSITRALKQLAKELNCPVVALAQLNRKLEERADKRPILSDLRESGSVEQDADVVLMVYRDELHNPDSPDKGCAELLIRKNRGGKIGMVPSRESTPAEPPKRRGFRRGGDQ